MGQEQGGSATGALPAGGRAPGTRPLPRLLHPTAPRARPAAALGCPQVFSQPVFAEVERVLRHRGKATLLAKTGYVGFRLIFRSLCEPAGQPADQPAGQAADQAADELTDRPRQLPVACCAWCTCCACCLLRSPSSQETPWLGDQHEDAVQRPPRTLCFRHATDSRACAACMQTWSWCVSSRSPSPSSAISSGESWRGRPGRGGGQQGCCRRSHPACV